MAAIDLTTGFQKKTVLVTGGAGFVGTNVVRTLLSLGAHVHVVDDLSTGFRENVPSSPHVDFHHADFADQGLLDELLPKVEYIIHLAARNIIAAIKNPLSDFETNIGATLKLLLRCVDHPNIQKIVYASSASVYGNPYVIPIHENEAKNPISCYAVSKLAGENYVSVFYENYDLPTCIVRYSNVYGPYQMIENPYCGVIGRFFYNVIESRDIYIHGDGEQTRDFTFVDDIVEGTLMCTLSPRAEGCIFNLASGVETKVGELAAKIMGLYGKNVKIKNIDKRDIDNIRRRCLNIESMRKRLKWEPSHSLDRGLAVTKEWFDGYFGKSKS